MRLADASSRRSRRQLKRLRTDAIDIYQVHWPDPETPIEETAEAMAQLHRQGKIHAIGVSSFSTAQMDAFSAVVPIHTLQPPYNLFEREIEREILPYALWSGVGVLAYGPICRGLLSGRMKPDTQFGGDDLTGPIQSSSSRAIRNISTPSSGSIASPRRTMANG